MGDNSGSSPASFRNSSPGGASVSTSPSTPESPGRLNHSPRATVSSEVSDFIADLSNYSAIGCLCYEHSAPRPEESAGCWREVIDHHLVCKFDDYLNSCLSKLLAQSWIRVQYSCSSVNPQYLVFRIYLLPEDVGLRFISRRNRQLFAAVEGLIARVDTNSNTWKGHHLPDQEQKFDLFATPVEGSLFCKCSYNATC